MDDLGVLVTGSGRRLRNELGTDEWRDDILQGTLNMAAGREGSGRVDIGRGVKGFGKGGKVGECLKVNVVEGRVDGG